MIAMILAAGKGKRMMPLTNNIPKPLIKVKGITLIEYSINALKKAKITNIVINVSYLGDKIKSYLGDGSKYSVNICYSEEAQYPLETAGGIIKALPLLADKPFIVLNSDILFDYDLSKLNLPIGSLAHLLLVDNPIHRPKGDFSLNHNQKVIDIDKHSLTFSGIGIYHPEMFKAVKNKQEKLPLSFLFKTAIANDNLTGEHFTGYWQDVGTPERLNLVNKND